MRLAFLTLRTLLLAEASPPWPSWRTRYVCGRVFNVSTTSLPEIYLILSFLLQVHELEAELAGTQARTGESAKAYQRAERKCKELAFTAGEDKKNQDRMTDLASKLQSKIKTYKQQIEEAEEIAALNLAKFRKAQQELEEVEERAKLAALI